MEIEVGKYILRSDRYSMWIDEVHEVKKGKTKGKIVTKRVAGYANTFDQLLKSFVAVKHRDNDAQTITELLKVLKQTAEDTEMIKKTALKADFKLVKQIANDVKERSK